MPVRLPVLRIRFFCTAEGREPVREWLKGLPADERKAAIAASGSSAAPISGRSAKKIAASLTVIASTSAIEVVLEGLHLANRLNKSEGDDGRVRYARR